MRLIALRLRPRSLTNRLVVTVIASTVVLVIGIGASTLFVLQRFLDKHLDEQLASDSGADQARYYFDRGPVMPGRRPDDDRSISAIAFDAHGHTATPNAGLAAKLRLNPSDIHRLVGNVGGPPVSLTSATGEHLRVRVVQVVDVPLASGRSLHVFAAIGLSTSDVSTTLHRVLAAELIIGSVAILAALAATTYGVRRNLRGLQTVTRVAWEVAADVTPEGGGLTRRVPMDEDNVSSEVGQLSYSMNTLLTAVETQVAERTRSEHRMRQFLLDASHELRTPLTSIRGFAELARMYREAGDGGPVALAEIGDNLDRIESEGVRMSRLVDDLLSLARSDEGAGVQFQFVELDEVAHDAASSARAAFPDRPIEVDAPPGLVVNGDHDQLRRVLTNLVANAGVHTRPGGPIRIAAHRAGDGSVVIRISDSGPGLAPDEAARVFDRFWRADTSRTRASGGSGLGLSIVAAITADHGGSVGFDSTVEIGSTVTVQLPPPREPDGPAGRRLERRRSLE
jgi:two-component system OmpR family sensor kinase